MVEATPAEVAVASFAGVAEVAVASFAGVVEVAEVAVASFAGVVEVVEEEEGVAVSQVEGPEVLVAALHPTVYELEPRVWARLRNALQQGMK